MNPLKMVQILAGAGLPPDLLDEVARLWRISAEIGHLKAPQRAIYLFLYATARKGQGEAEIGGFDGKAATFEATADRCLKAFGLTPAKWVRRLRADRLAHPILNQSENHP